ncbi:hypothetical protein [Defluviimonas sp. SAOS-178_SWC]|uniref:hypothetical protein n=1 Tax=Defluviimonas sp. SAOS-178_SWC TaxID=3121287 RepID=UPI003221AB90
MSKAFLAAFAVITAGAAGAVDYINQARVAGSAPGRFAAGAYVATIPARLTGQRQAAETPALRGNLSTTAARDPLPEATEGGTRGEFDPGEIKEDPALTALDVPLAGIAGVEPDLDTEPETVSSIKEAAALPADGAAPDGSRGIWGMISGVLGGGDRNSDPQSAPSEVTVKRIGGSNCTLSDGVKRCSIGGD